MTWPITYRRKIRYSDTDAQAIVFNGNYLTYFDDALTDLFDHAGLAPAVTHADGYDVVTAHASLDFRAPAAIGDVVVTGAKVARIGTKSVEFALQSWIEETGTVTADGKVVFVTVDAGSFKPVEVPEGFVAAMQRVHAERIPSGK